MTMPTPSAYDAARRSVALADRSDRVRIEVTGPDRAKVVHNLTTNEVKRLEPGRGREAFVTNGQGRTVGYLTVHADADRLLLDSDPGTADALLAHFATYAVFDDARFLDVSATTCAWHLVGPETDGFLAGLGLSLPPADDLASGLGSVDGCPVRSIRERPTGRPGVSLLFTRDDLPTLTRALRDHVVALDPATFDALRIEAGTPVFGRDATPANLPQEVGRDARAISFVKGCYLGQETVARLDALGHVNKILIGAIRDDDDPSILPAGSILQAGGIDVGVVTSSSFSPGWGRGVVLGYVKVAHAKPGTRLLAAGSIGLTVHAPPMLP